MFSVHGTQVSHITGHSRPPGEVGLTPRQYTEWNVAGYARSTGDPSQQGLLPEVYRTASTGRCAHLHNRVLNKPTNYQQRTDPRSCVRVVYIAGDTLRHQPMGAGHMTVLQLRGPMAFRVLQWCHPMLTSTTRTSCCTRMITLYGARKWIQAHAISNAFNAIYVDTVNTKHIHTFLLITFLIFNGFSIRKKFWRAVTQSFSTIPSILYMLTLSIQDKDL